MNIYGYGAYSNSVTIIPTDVPDKVDIPSVVISLKDVKVSWGAPDDHYSSIDSYEILFEEEDGSYTTDTADCDGNDTSVINSTLCYVPMTTMIAKTSLPVDSLIRVKVRAHNSKGWGDYSELNTDGATIETIPTQMSSPTYDLSLSSNSIAYV